MRVQDNVGKISWTVADKILFVLYGFVALVQIRSLSPSEVGLYSMLVGLQSWIFIVSDGAALQGIIQFGMEKSGRAGVHTVALITHVAICLGVPVVVAVFANPLSSMFHEPRIAEVAHWLPLFCLLTLPRTFCLKVLFRDSQMKQVFWTNFAWFGTMTALTFWMIRSGSLQSFTDLTIIASTGIGISSTVALLLSYKLIPLSMRELPSLRSFFRFGFIQVAVSALTNAVRQLDILVVQFFFHDLSFLGMYYSAKTFFRVFETGLDALFSVIYPAAVRLLPAGKTQEFTTMVTKGISYVLLSYVALIAVLELGGTSILVSLLGGKYTHVGAQLNVMILAAVFLPFSALYAVLLAEHRNVLMLRHVLVATLAGLAVFVVCGTLQLQSLFPLGVVLYNAVLAALLYFSVRKGLNLRAGMFLRAIPDVYNFLRNRQAA
jgi:O-antigen/teichoic acid export membrane protein